MIEWPPMFTWDSLPHPILALAPMAGYTDSAYRQLIKEVCPQVVCFTEFTSVDGILHGNEATMRQVTFNPDKERPLVAQIFGKKPANFAKATKVLTELGVDAIDINMGCPAKKIISSDHGSALLKNPSLAEEIVQATVEATHLDVSVKTRVGTTCYDPDFFMKFGQSMERAGAKLITVHGRTSKQMYSGTSDWQPIYDLKKILKIPVIGNGDVRNGAEALTKLQNLDGVMVGRATFGNPWVLCDIWAALHGGSFSALNFAQKLPWIRRHLQLSCEFKGEKWGMLEMRKHFAWYLKGLPHASEARVKRLVATSAEEAMGILEGFTTAAPIPVTA